MNKKNELSIMNKNLPYWDNERFNGSERHEAFFGRKNRQKSIDDGLVVFLTPELHRGTKGIHGKLGHEFDIYLKTEAERIWCEHYNKTPDEFRQKYGKNYL